MFNNWGNVVDEVTGVHKINSPFVGRFWTKNDDGYDIIVAHVGIDDVKVQIYDGYSIHIFGENEIFGEKFFVDVGYYLPCKQSEIEKITYQTINGVTMIRVFVQERKDRKIPIIKEV